MQARPAPASPLCPGATENVEHSVHHTFQREVRTQRFFIEVAELRTPVSPPNSRCPTVEKLDSGKFFQLPILLVKSPFRFFTQIVG